MIERVMARYRRFAEQEAHGHSPLYEAIALGIAGDPKLLDILAHLPEVKQQPNLLLAALRLVAGTPADWPDFRARLMQHLDAVLRVVRERDTQTNEPARCAVLLPLLARLHQPLALLEVGASAGLCLLMDRYRYDYGGVVVGREGDAPVFACRASGSTPVPDRVPDISWRAGLDLSPLNLRDEQHVAWLEALVWPDQTERLDRLRAAIATARSVSVRVMKGDLVDGVASVLDQAPKGPTPVVFHSAVLGYVADPARRAAFVEAVFDQGAVWVSNEVPRVFPEIAERASRPGPPGAFLLAVNGEPMAWTDPHGAWIDWLED
jgi:hypothetical protein